MMMNGKPNIAELRPHRGRDRNRLALLAAGERLFSAASVSAVSIDDIVLAAGVAKGTFYNHFSDKDDLHQAIVEHARHQVRALIEAKTAALDDPARRMARGFCIAFRYSLDHPERAVFLAKSAAPQEPITGELNAGIVSFVSDGLASGRFVLATVESGVLLMHGLLHASGVSTHPDAGDFTRIARAQQLTALLLRGLGIGLAEADLIAAQEADKVLREHLSDCEGM